VRVVFYTHPAFFEPALQLTRELSQRVELHVLLEVSPWSWQLAGFDVPKLGLRPGLVPADHALGQYLPPPAREILSAAAGAHLVVHQQRRSLTLTTWRITQEVLGFLRKLRPDVVHVDDADESLRLAIGLPWRLKAPLVLNVHDPQPHSGEADWHIPLARWLLYRRAARFVLYNAAMQRTFTARHHIPMARTRTIPLGVYSVAAVDAPQSELKSEPGRVVLFFGRISRYKGLDVLYEAAPLVAAQVPDVRFVIAGRPVPNYRLPTPPELPGDARIELIPEYIHNERAHKLFESARVVVCPYRDATQSGVILTSYAFRKPVVATRVGGLSEYVDDGTSGLLIPPGDPRALAAALVRVLTDSELQQRLSAGIDELSKGRLSWAHSANEFLDLYREVVVST
jgi:glycosyltransferase involved in cell wall biosynthesis